MKTTPSTSWRSVRLGEVAQVNPTKPSTLKDLDSNLDVSFVPMKAVDEHLGKVTNQDVRKLKSVSKGYTYFQNDWVLFAKITPCMENGKSAIARDLVNGIGFGSTEFHTIVPSDEIIPEYIYHFLKQEKYRYDAKLSFRGAVGQQRVPPEFIRDTKIPLPKVEEQQKIVDKIEELFSVIDQQCKLILLMSRQASTIRQSLLQAAVSGRLNHFSSVKKAALKDLGSWSGGGTPSKSAPKFWEDGDIPWVSPKDMKSRLIIDSQDKITQEAVDNSSAKLISAGSLLVVTRSGILRRTLPVAVTKVDVTVNQDIKALTPDENTILGDYLLILFEAFNQDIRYKCSKSGTTVESIEFPTLLRYEVEYPGIDEQKKVIQLVNEFESIIFAEERSLKETNKIANWLKQSILKQAFEGKLV